MIRAVSIILLSTAIAKVQSCSKGEPAKNTDRLSMRYVGTIDESSATGTPGEQFDASREPFNFVLGAGEVIKGWDRQLVGACINDHKIFTVPPEEGYGEAGVGPIPGGATLRFEVDVLDITPGQGENDGANQLLTDNQ